MQVSSDARGRGTIKLIRLHQWIDMLWLPIMAAQLAILASPATQMPIVACLLSQLVYGFLWFNSYFRGLAIALSRYDGKWLEGNSPRIVTGFPFHWCPSFQDGVCHHSYTLDSAYIGIGYAVFLAITAIF